MCANAVPYSGSVCRNELLAMTQCFPDIFSVSDNDPVLVLVSSESLSEMTQLLNAFELFGSPECVAAATPFLCVYLFGGLCDEGGQHYLPTAGECEEISTGICRREWQLARSFGMDIVDCRRLPRELPSLCASNFSSGSGDVEEAVIPEEENGKLAIIISFPRKTVLLKGKGHS